MFNVLCTGLVRTSCKIKLPMTCTWRVGTGTYLQQRIQLLHQTSNAAHIRHALQLQLLHARLGLLRGLVIVHLEMARYVSIAASSIIAHRFLVAVEVHIAILGAAGVLILRIAQMELMFYDVLIVFVARVAKVVQQLIGNSGHGRGHGAHKALLHTRY